MTDDADDMPETIIALRGAAAGLVYARSQFAAFYDDWLADRPPEDGPHCFLYAVASHFERAAGRIEGLNPANDADALALAICALGSRNRMLSFLGAAAGGGLFSLSHASADRDDNGILDRFINALGGTKAVAQLQRAEFQAMTSREIVWTDPGHLLPALILARRRLCIIRVRNEDEEIVQTGTGFLIGPSTVLTNHHVVEGCDFELDDPTQIEVRFDYSATTGMAEADASCFHPLVKWRMAWSDYGPTAPPDGADDEDENADQNWWTRKRARDAWRNSVAGTLDYAVIRLAAAPGLQRGWYDLREAGRADRNEGCWVLHHPSRQDQTLTGGDIYYPKKGVSRIFHSASTVSGSSGGLVLNAMGAPIGLHHLGLYLGPEGADIAGLDAPEEVLNCAVSLRSIADDLEAKGVLAEIAAAPRIAPHRGCLDGVRPVFGRQTFLHDLERLYSETDGRQIMRVHVQQSVADVLKPGKSFTIEMIKALFRPPEHHHIVFRAGEIKVDARGQTEATLEKFAPEAVATLPDAPDTTSPAFIRRLVNHLGVAIRERLTDKTVWMMIDDLDKHDVSDGPGREFLATLYDQIAGTPNLRIVLIGLPETIDIGGLASDDVVKSSIGGADLNDRQALFAHWLNERGARDIGISPQGEKLLSLTAKAYAGETAPLRRMAWFASQFMSGALDEVMGRASATDDGGEDA